MWLIGWSHPGAAASGSAAGGGSPAGGGSAAAAPRSRLRLEGRWRGGRRRPAWRATARRAATRRRAAAWQRRRFGAGSAAGGLAAGGSAAAAAWQRRRLGVSSAFTCRLAYRSAYPGAYPYLSGVTYRICVVWTIIHAQNAQYILACCPFHFQLLNVSASFVHFYPLEFVIKASAYRTAYLSLSGKHMPRAFLIS